MFWKAFLSTRGGYRVGIPRVPLGDLYDGCKEAHCQAGRGSACCAPACADFCVAEGGVEGVEREDGSVETADYYLAAVPQDVLPELLPPEVVEREPVFSNLRNLRTSPITGVHLWFDRTVMSEPFLTLLDSTTQWVFNKTQLYGEGGGKRRTISAAGDQRSYSLAQRSRQEIIALCLDELREVLPATREATLVKGTVVKEMCATFSPAPGSDQWRPAQKSPAREIISCGGLDRHRLAVDNGRSGPQRLPGRRSDPLRCRHAAEIFAARFAAEGLARLWARRLTAQRSSRTALCGYRLLTTKCKNIYKIRVIFVLCTSIQSMI